MALSQTPTIESPCKLICTLDLSQGLCRGCGRTREEIAGWTRMSPSMRRVVMAELEERLEALSSET